MRKELSLIPFDCARTCPVAGNAWCRFRAVLDGLGPARVLSHTCRVAVQYRDADTLRAAVLALGGIWYGWNDAHELFETKEQGWGFRLPFEKGAEQDGGVPGTRYWLFPVVVGPDGQLAYDDYKGAWGDVTQLELLRQEYAVQHTMHKAEELGWQCERTGEGVTVFHPDGGTLTLSRKGECEAFGFVGGACHTAREALGLAVAGEAVNKPECAQQVAQCSLPERRH
jgi:hypothetical protein